MAANMKAVKLRIRSVQNTMQITRAMELVASSKLRRAKERADICRPYFKELHRTLVDIADSNTDFTSVYAKNKKETDQECYILIAGDRGMAGGYNSNLFKCMEAHRQEKDCTVLPIGKKSVEYARRKKLTVITEEFNETADVSVADCFEIANLVCGLFRRGEAGHIHLCYTHFDSMLSQVPDLVPILPLPDLKSAEKEGKAVRDLILYEPSAEEVFDAIVPEYLAGLIYAAVCDSLASELAARRTAMEAATKNAGEMIDQLNLYYNRARQASITQEITEIVAGADGI